MKYPDRYKFSFTTSSLRLTEMVLVAKQLKEGFELDITNDLGGGKSATGKKMFSELNKRVAQLNSQETEILINGDLVSQKQMAFLAVCKSYDFIRDFTVEVLREKLLVFDYEITDGDYISFYRRKTDSHPEMEERTEITQKKIRRVIFKVLEQAGIINDIKAKTIQPQLLDNRVIEAIVSDDSTWLKVFLMSDLDITNLTN